MTELLYTDFKHKGNRHVFPMQKVQGTDICVEMYRLILKRKVDIKGKGQGKYTYL